MSLFDINRKILPCFKRKQLRFWEKESQIQNSWKHVTNMLLSRKKEHFLEEELPKWFQLPLDWFLRLSIYYYNHGKRRTFAHTLKLDWFLRTLTFKVDFSFVEWHFDFQKFLTFRNLVEKHLKFIISSGSGGLVLLRQGFLFLHNSIISIFIKESYYHPYECAN